MVSIYSRNLSWVLAALKVRAGKLIDLMCHRYNGDNGERFVGVAPLLTG
jgi:hypothetical protein